VIEVLAHVNIVDLGADGASNGPDLDLAAHVFPPVALRASLAETQARRRGSALVAGSDAMVRHHPQIGSHASSLAGSLFLVGVTAFVWTLLRTLLRHRRLVAHQRRAPNVSRLVVRKRPCAMHRLAVVPHDEITHPPSMRIDELALR